MLNPSIFFEFGRRRNMFVSTWDTRNLSSGSSDYNQIKLPFPNVSPPNDVAVEWGDGTSTLIPANTQLNNTSLHIHTYSPAGIYTVTIHGLLKGVWQFVSDTDRLKILKIKSWGGLIPTNRAALFQFCSNLDLSELNEPLNTSEATNLQSAFQGTGLSFIPQLENIDVSNVIDMSRILHTTNINQNISGWDTSNVQRMEGLLNGNNKFNQDISAWDVRKVLDMAYMFFGATAFNRDISSWMFNKNVLLQNFMTGKSHANYNPVFYDNLLIKWSSIFIGTGRTAQKNVGMGAIKYTSAGKPFRDALVADGWTITDGGQI